MFDDFKERLFVLNKHKVKYLVVGAYAVGYHAQPRATKDLDVLIQPAPKNGEAIYRALVEFGAPNIQNLSPDDFTDEATFYRMGVPPVAVDILPAIKGILFHVAWKNRIPVTVDAETGLTANFISRDDLIAAKLADLGDVAAIRAATADGSAEPKRSEQIKPRSKKKPRTEP